MLKLLEVACTLSIVVWSSSQESRVIYKGPNSFILAEPVDLLRAENNNAVTRSLFSPQARCKRF